MFIKCKLGVCLNVGLNPLDLTMMPLLSSKEDLLKLYQEQREAALRRLESLNDEDLSTPGPKDMPYVPTVGSAFELLGCHWLMHAGQWAVIRRQLGRPPLF